MEGENMLYLQANESIGASDAIVLQCGEKEVTASVVDSGEGTASLDDPLYWLHAPSKNVPYSMEPPEVSTSYLLVKIDTSAIPFEKLPREVTVWKRGGKEKYRFLATALVGLSVNEDGYLVYLEYEQ